MTGRIIPLNGKLPAIPNPHAKGSRERLECHGECGHHPVTASMEQHDYGCHDHRILVGVVNTLDATSVGECPSRCSYSMWIRVTAALSPSLKYRQSTAVFPDSDDNLGAG